MDYEKKYKDALERAKEMCAMPTDKATMEYIFPELRESEDERIRKHLLLHFRNKTKETWCNMPVKDIIAYLEKQKEQKPVEWSDTNELVFKDICKHLKEEGYNGWIVVLEALRNGEFNQKSLRLQPHWKPTEKELTALKNLMNGKFPDGIFPGATLSELYTKLSKLYYNEAIPQWKPSEKQMEALKDCGECKRCVKELREQLKKLM